MSTYLASYFDAIPLGYEIIQMQNVFVGNLTANGWQLLAQVDGLGGYSDLIPPATEPIGTSQFREVVRIYFPNNTTITIGSYQVCIADAYPQSIRLTAKTAGEVQAGVTIGGVTVLGAMGSAGSTANDNLRALFYALKDSVDATITGWAYDYNGTDTLICTNKTVAAMVTCSGNTNVNYFAHAQSVLNGSRSGRATIDATYGYSVTMDLTNGFVYYMDIFSRSFSLSTKCLSGVTGPIFASYADHTESTTIMPLGGPCTPMELWVGKSDAASGRAYAKPTHWWAIGYTYYSKPESLAATTTTVGSTVDDGDAHPFTGAINPTIPTDAWLTFDNAVGFSYPLEVVFGELSNVEIQAGNSSDIRMAAAYRVSGVRTENASEFYSVASHMTYRFMGGANLPDIAKWHGTEPNEAAALCKVQPPLSTYPTLAQALDATTAYSSILLSSTAGLPIPGSLIIGTEGYTYTGVSGASVTGVARGANGTVQARHFVGDVVSPAVWFLKVNNGAVCCGPTAPV